jgi:phosphoribosylformylglycinamidine synthase
MKVDAYLGALDAVAYPTLQMAVKGARACAVTDCLNFGNPERLEIMSEFVASVEAITEIAQKLQTPVISGNVSFYNETQGANIISTPATGLIGVRESVEDLPRDHFTVPGQSVFIVKLKWAELDLKAGQFAGSLPIEKIRAFQNLILEMEAARLFSASQMVGLGGLAVTLSKMALAQAVGFSSQLSSESIEWHMDGLYQAVFAAGDAQAMENFLREKAPELTGEIEWKEIGMTGGESVKFGMDVTIPIQGLVQKYQSGLEPLI